MTNITFGDILRFANNLKQDGMTLDDIKSMSVYLGDDEELNGIHTAWYINMVDTDDASNADDRYFIELINDTAFNVKLAGKGIVIS